MKWFHVLCFNHILLCLLLHSFFTGVLYDFCFIWLQAVQSNIQELRQIAFDTDPDSSSNSKRQSHINEFKKLGFKVIAVELILFKDVQNIIICFRVIGS